MSMLQHSLKIKKNTLLQHPVQSFPKSPISNKFIINLYDLSATT